jgi:23S rRNA (guanine2445-N2)-methyltransferase / 23S rRNA (guanine2069-N7)-methyltransferase
LVNLSDYLDTGLFLDHRLTRLRIQQLAAGKVFLNLFCYTGAATMHAIQGGARRSLSVDMSPKYITWGRKNLALNGFGESLHRFEQADCLQLLKQHEAFYDLIFLDSPTFSNSKKMQGILDLQRDHTWLIRQTMLRLNDGGLLIFSNNFRRFIMADEIKAEFDVQDITSSSIDIDFKRNPKIHNCWEIRHR